MIFRHVTISVKDMEKSIQFYKDVTGQPIKRRFTAGESEIVFLGAGETEIELIYTQAKSDVSFGPDISLGFEVESLEDTIKFLKQKNIDVGKVIQPNPHVRFAFAADPNGLTIQFVENIK